MSNITPSYEFLSEKLKDNMNQVSKLQQNKTPENLVKIQLLFEHQDSLMDSFLEELHKRDNKTIEDHEEVLALLENLRDFGIRGKER